MLISDHLHADCIDIDLNNTNKKEIIEKLARILFKRHPELDDNIALQSLFARETLLSTGIGSGIAIPHARLDKCDDVYIAIGIARNEVNFNALDGKPVQIIALVFFPKDKANLQLRMLAQISQLMQGKELKTKLIDARTAKEAFHAITSYEENTTI